MEKIACDTNSMKQLSCASVVFPLSSVQLSVFVRLFTQHHATNTPCRTPSAIAPRPRTDSTAIDSIISTLACATSVSTYAPATAQILIRVEYAMSLSSCACSVQSYKKPFLPVSHDQLHTAHSARPLHRWMHRRRASRSRYILQNVAQIGPNIGAIMSHTKWQHACRTKFMHTCNCDHFVRPQQILDSCARALG